MLLGFEHEKYGVSYIDFDKLRNALATNKGIFSIVQSTSILRGSITLDTKDNIIFDNIQPKLLKSKLSDDEKDKIINAYHKHWE